MAKKKSESKKPSPEEVRSKIQELTGQERAGLFPPHIDRVRELTDLELAPSDEMSYAALIESICGTTDDSQPVEQYDGTLGVTVAFVNNRQGPVGQLQWNGNLSDLYDNPGNVAGVRWCSGTLISNDLFLTAGHCFDQTGGGWVRPLDDTTGSTIAPAEIATNMHVNFNYQVDPAGDLRVEQSFPIQSLVEYRLGSLDFAVVRLGGNPGATFGTTAISTTDAAIGDMLCIIGHPAGWPKRIEAGPATSFAGDRIRYDDIDTLGGNSGSGILRASDGRIVGVHTNGGCNAAGTGENSGVRITSIIGVSPTLQSLTRVIKRPPLDKPVRDVKLKFVDDGGTIKFVDDGGTLKFVDDGGTLKFIDDGGTLKHVDDVKSPALDKGFSDMRLPAGRHTRFLRSLHGEARGRARPFVLSTPHHSMTWAETSPPHSSDEDLASRYELAIQQLHLLMQAAAVHLAELEAEYDQLVAEYASLSAGDQGS